jgi:hypothetical protein
VKYRLRLTVFGLLIFSLVFAAACSGLGVLSGQPKDKWQQLVEQENEKIGLKPLKLEPYAKEVGGELREPRYQKFAVNSSFTVAGSVKKTAGMKSKHVWIDIRKTGGSEIPGAKKFSYYTPLKDGTFRQRVQLFAGKGEYLVTVRMPSEATEGYYHDFARFRVVNVNPEVKRDIGWTPAGLEAGLKLTRPKTGYQAADGIFDLEGSISNSYGSPYIMVLMQKGSEKWQRMVRLKDGRFKVKVPLYFGKGIHELKVMVPIPDRKSYYQEGASLLVKNTSAEKREPIKYYKQYEERGVHLEHPVAGGEKADMKYRISGTIDPQAPDASRTTHLIIQTKKDGEEATYFIPVKNYRFDGKFWLRFGPGKYEVTVNVPEITDERRDYFRFYSVAEFTVINTAKEDKRYLLPSRGIQSDAPEIKELAERLTAGKKSERSKARAIYDYVAKNITYDVQKYRNDEFALDDSALKTLERKKGVCQDYSFLAIALLRSIGMEARFVEGIADGIRHAWVEVKVDGRWLTMDPTWGSGYLNPNGWFVKKYNPEYFDPSPAEFRKTHTRTGVMY